MIQSFWEVYQYLNMAGILGTICSVCVILFLICKKEPSNVSLTYAIGSFIAFAVGGSHFGIPEILRITWGNVIGVVGGYLLLLLSLVQFLFEKRSRSKTIIEEKSSKSA